jgi:hypothetical protein
MTPGTFFRVLVASGGQDKVTSRASDRSSPSMMAAVKAIEAVKATGLGERLACG